MQPLPRNELSKRELTEFRKTARLLEADPWHLHDAAHYLRALCTSSETDSWPSPPELNLNEIFAQPDLMALPLPPGWTDFAPQPPRQVTTTLVRAMPKAKAFGKALGKAKAKGKGKAKGKAKAKADAAPSLEGPPDAPPTLGCIKCRYAKTGCSRCKNMIAP